MAKMLHSGFLLFLFCALQTNAVPAIVPPSSDFDSLSLLRPVDSTEPDALLKFVVAELERSKREAGTLGMCEGIEVAHIMEKHHKVENGIKYEISLKMKPVHIVTDSCNNKPVKNVIPSTIEDCQIEVWEGVTVAGEMHPMALLRSSCKIQRD
ncbi:uncharacterized protein LOC100904815 [Galendromus occidentalis]|uniref:Uncharacterized protein LOC100904815 n=1 Tax=Galendromus occidentalis TaxID=34638 RepID=A0AAJ6QVU7_9ACAR|nr:uncharacterized protein LOC100904815 [Galendromus occidentalis]